MTSATCGQRSPDAPASLAPASNGSSSKTSPVTSASALKPCCESFETWASRLRLAYSRRAKLARRTKGSGSSSWPTATGTDANGARSFATDGTRIRANAGPTLNDKVANWGTPRASDGEKGGPNQSFGAGGMPLPAQAAQWTTPQAHDVSPRGSGQIPSAKAGNRCLARDAQQWPTPMAGTPAQNGNSAAGNSAAGNSDFSRRADMLAEQVMQASAWPTPAARDWKGENGADHLQNGTGRLHMDQLPNAVAHGFTRPDLPTWQGGLTHYRSRPGSRRLLRSVTSHVSRTKLRQWLKRGWWRKRRLNPLFVEWLMGWPCGHALCACSETEFTRWQQDMRGALSQLPTASGPWIWAPDDGAETDNLHQMSLFP